MNRFYQFSFAGLVLATGLIVSPVQEANAQLVTYNFNGSNGLAPTYPPVAQPTNASASVMRRGSGTTIPTTATADVITGTGWNSPALDTADYFAFSVAPNASYVLNLDSLVFDEKRSGSGPLTWAVRSSLDNYTSNLGTYTYTGTSVTAINLNQKVVLGAPFDMVTGPVEFRFYAYGATAAGGTWRLDNVRLYGAAIPSGPAPVLSFASTALTVGEAAVTANLTLTLANPSTTAPTTVDVVVTGGTATAGTDYTYTTQTVTFPAGSSASQTVTINITDDTDIESDETIVLELQNATSGVTIGSGTMTVTITDNDTPPPVIPLVTIATATVNDANGVPVMDNAEVRLRGIVHGMNLRGHLTTPGLQFTLIDNTGGIGIFRTSGLLGYTFAEGDSLEVTGNIDQFNGLTQLAVTNIQVLSSNNPLETPVTVTALTEATESELVRLANPVTIVDPTQWTNSGSGFTVNVTDGTNTYPMRITSAVVSLYGQPAPAGWFYLTGLGGQFDSSTPFTEGYQLAPRYAADLAFVPSVDFSSSTQSVTEAAGTATITLNITNPNGTAATTVDVVVTGGTATAGADFTYTTQTVSFAAGSTASQTVTITVIDDAVIEADETIVLALQNASTGAIIGNGATYTLTITDNDVSGLAENVVKGGLQVYPNPATDVVRMNFATAATANTQVQLINQLGQVVATSAVANGAVSHQFSIANYPAGIYVVRMLNNEAVKTATVVKH